MSSQPPLARSIQKLFPFFFSLSLAKTGAGTVAAASSFSWYNTVLRERTDPPLSSIHFFVCFFLYIFRLDLSSFFFVSSLNSGDFKPSSPFCERALFKSDVFSLSLFFARSSQHHSGDDDDARPTFCRRPVTPTHSRSRALGERTRLNFKKPSRDRF